MFISFDTANCTIKLFYLCRSNEIVDVFWLEIATFLFQQWGNKSERLLFGKLQSYNVCSCDRMKGFIIDHIFPWYLNEVILALRRCHLNAQLRATLQLLLRFLQLLEA